MFNIGTHYIDKQAILAPMAGVTDQPFRTLCRQLGAGLAVSEMVTADKRLWNTRKSSNRLRHEGEIAPRIVQIAGGDPEMLCEAAQINADQGAEIIDINMGCPAKKVCNKAAGSALLKDEKLVESILTQVVSSVDIPVTLKIRTGWSIDQRNALTVAKMAEQAGIQALAIHGRTRACGYRGEAEYDTIAAVKQQLTIPVFVNGDITSALKAREVLDYTKADAVMIGRAAQGKPWIFQEINHFLATGEHLPEPSNQQIHQWLVEHLNALYAFYDEYLGVRIARKHVGWYLADKNNLSRINTDRQKFRKLFNQLETSEQQLAVIQQFFAGDDFDHKAA